MVAALPTTVPWCAVNSSYSEEIERNVVAFRPAVGPPKQRRRSSISDLLISFSRSMTRAQWETLKGFYRNDLADGVLTFTAKHPADLAVGTFLFTDAPKASQFANKRMVQIAVRLTRLQFYDIFASDDILAEPDIFAILAD